MKTVGLMWPPIVPRSVRPVTSSAPGGIVTSLPLLVMTEIVPCFAAELTAARITCGFPVVSRMASAPPLPAARTTCAVTSASSRPVVSTACVAPSSSARSRRCRTRSTATISRAPDACAAITAARPTAPVPNTATVWCGATPIALSITPAPVCTPQVTPAR